MHGRKIRRAHFEIFVKVRIDQQMQLEQRRKGITALVMCYTGLGYVLGACAGIAWPFLGNPLLRLECNRDLVVSANGQHRGCSLEPLAFVFFLFLLFALGWQILFLAVLLMIRECLCLLMRR